MTSNYWERGFRPRKLFLKYIWNIPEHILSSCSKTKYMLPSQFRELERQADVIEQNPERESWDVTRNKYVTATKNFADRYGYKDISNHITDVMVSIMMTRDKVLSGGSFVQAICENNLKQCIDRADNDCINHLKLLSLTHSFCHVESEGL